MERKRSWSFGPCNEGGTTMLEFAFVFPILILVLFAIVDFSRYWSVVATLRAGASDGLNRARKIPNFDLDWRGQAPMSRDYRRFVQARTRILDEAESVANAVAAREGTSGADTVLRDMTVTDNGLVGGSAPSYTRSSAVLRPGDCADISGHGTICNGIVASNLSPGDLMENHPLEVVMVADVKSILPFVGTYPAWGRAFGYREAIPPAPIDSHVDPDDVLGPRPSPTPIVPAAGNPVPSPSPLPCVQTYTAVFSCISNNHGAPCVLDNTADGDGYCKARPLSEAGDVNPGF